MNLKFVFSKSMNLNFVFSKSTNLNLIFSKSMNLNFKIRKKMNGFNPSCEFVHTYQLMLLLVTKYFARQIQVFF